MLIPVRVSLANDDGIKPVTRLNQRVVILIVALLLCLTGAACNDDSSENTPVATATVAPPASATTSTAQPVSESSAATASVTATAIATHHSPEATATSTPVSLPTPRTVEQAAPPVRLRIPALGIDTAVQWVGVDADGRMGVPSNYTDVAWYERGPTPGTPGNAVIDGHLDSRTGPAVFYRLEDLKPGDEVFTITDSGTEYRFVVISAEVYDANDAPLERIFGTAVGPHLNLITCDGAFDRSIRQYDKRLVVFTELAG